MPGYLQPVSEQWVAISGLFVDTEYLTAGYSGDQSGAVGMSFGAWWWQSNNTGAAIEASFFYDSHTATAAGIPGDVETWDWMLGGRYGFRTDSGKVVVYGKGGFLYRIDDGNGFNTVSSEGWGGYIGAGFELRMGEHFAVAPDFMWTFSDVVGNSRQFVAGVSAVFRF
jgi:hypothetical protein